MRPDRSLVVALLGTLALTGCTFVADFIRKAPDEQLVDQVLARWATSGSPFMDGAFGSDTVSAVAETEERTWEVTAGDATYALAVTRVHVYPVYSGEAFGRWVSDRARALGYRTFVPQDVLAPIAAGQIVAVGDMEVQFGEASRAGRSTWERVAYFRVQGEGAPSWSIQPESRTANVIRDALKTVYDDMLFTDDRVMDCLGSASPGTVERSLALECIGKVLDQEYGL